MKNNQEILLDLADFTLQEQPGEHLMSATSLAWYNSSYTLAAKPIKSLELHYTMIQLLIIQCIIEKTQEGMIKTKGYMLLLKHYDIMFSFKISLHQQVLFAFCFPKLENC